MRETALGFQINILIANIYLVGYWATGKLACILFALLFLILAGFNLMTDNKFIQLEHLERLRDSRRFYEILRLLEGIKRRL